MTDEANPQGVAWVPIYRRRWFIVCLLILFAPLSLIPVFSGDIYLRQAGSGLWVPAPRGAFHLFAVVFSVLALATWVRAIPRMERAWNDAAAAASDAGQTDATADPRLKLELLTNGMLKITATNDTPVTILSVLINNRKSVAGCDYSPQMEDANRQYLQTNFNSAPPAPDGTTLKTGDEALVEAINCGSVVKVEVVTDVGTGDYAFEP